LRSYFELLDLKMGWVEAQDPKTGKTYYYNKATKKVSWNKPEELQGTTKSDDPNDPNDPNNDPTYWRETKDQKTNRVYYYNKKTKKCVWQRPACLGADPSKDKDKDKKDKNQSSSQKKDVWKEATDPKSGRPYWYNKKTKKTTWKNPHTSNYKVEKPKTVEISSESKEPESDIKIKKVEGMFDDSDDDDDDDEDEDEDGAVEEVSNKDQTEGIMKKKEEQYQTNIMGVDNDEEDDEDAHDFKFAKHRHGWLNRVLRTGTIMDDQKLLTFKKSLIKKALLKENRSIDQEAVQCFKNIMSYMGDRKSSKKDPIKHVKKMLRNLMQSPAGLRDEAYMQLCKQTTDNPRIESTTKGWELMVLCLATFPPSKRLKDFLMDYIGRTISSVNGNPNIIKLAKCCKLWLPQIVKMGQRKHYPSKLEIKCLIDVKDVPIKVHLVDNTTFKTFNVTPYNLVKDVEEWLIEKYNLTAIDPFALYEQADENVERILDSKDRILDVMASWESKKEEIIKDRDAPSKKEKGKYSQHKDMNKKVVIVDHQYKNFLFKAKLVLKTTNKEIMSDAEAVHLIYLQAVHDVVTERYPSNEKDITGLAALQLQATEGDFKREYNNGWFPERIEKYMPVRLIQKKGKVQNDLLKQWEVKILGKYRKLAGKGFHALDAKLNYLDHVQLWPFYGAKFFIVEQRQFKDYPSPITLGINCEGVQLMHPEKKTKLESYLYTDIVTWGHSDEKFIIVVGNIVQQRKLIFKTTEGKHMNHLIHDYVKYKVKTNQSD